mmetsp:Transcript_14206/g.40406  ORF Transcript_14206/g.40406 Transcript_14206/m.40406 type:complete len:649 (+) Transcript_14206:447-2393(+)
MQLPLQLTAAAGQRGCPATREVVRRKEVAERDELAFDAPLLLLFLDFPAEVVVPSEEPLVRNLVTHRPLAESIEHQLRFGGVVPADEGESPPGEQRDDVDILHHLSGHHLRPDVLAHVHHGEQLRDGVLELQLVRVCRVWSKPHVMVPGHVEDAPELFLEDHEAALDGVEGVTEVSGDDEAVVFELRGGDPLGPRDDVAVVDVHVGDREDSDRSRWLFGILGKSLDALLGQRGLQPRDGPERVRRLLLRLAEAALEVRGVQVGLVGVLGVALTEVRAADAEVGLEPCRRSTLRRLPVAQGEAPLLQLGERRGAVRGEYGERLLHALVALGDGAYDREGHGVVRDGQREVSGLQRGIPRVFLLLGLSLPVVGGEALREPLGGLPQANQVLLGRRIELHCLDVASLCLRGAAEAEEAEALAGMAFGPVRPEFHCVLCFLQRVVMLALLPEGRREVRVDRRGQLGVALRVLIEGLAVKVDGLVWPALLERLVALALQVARPHHHQRQVVRLAADALVALGAFELHLEPASRLVLGDDDAPAAVEVRAALQAFDIDEGADCNHARRGRRLLFYWLRRLLLRRGRCRRFGCCWLGIFCSGLGFFIIEADVPHRGIHRLLPCSVVGFRRHVHPLGQVGRGLVLRHAVVHHWLLG